MNTIAIKQQAVNKVFFYSQNYPVVKVDYLHFKCPRTEYLPAFFKDCFPSDKMAHFVEKWRHCYEKYGSHSALLMFYFELSKEYRAKVLEWILANYNNEIELF